MLANVRPIKFLWGNKKLRLALLAIIVGVLIGSAWLVWPEPDLRLRLKVERDDTRLGKYEPDEWGVFCRVEGAEGYDLAIVAFRYIPGEKPPDPEWPTGSSRFELLSRGREFFTHAPKASEVGGQSWRMQIKFLVLVDNDSKASRLFNVIKDTWKTRSIRLAKLMWHNHQRRAISEQTLISDLITNTPSH